MSKKQLLSPLFIILFIIYEELIFHTFVFNNFTIDVIYIILFSIPVGLLIYLITSIFKEQVNRILLYLSFTIITALFIANFVYYKVYMSIISIFSLLNGNQVLGFMNHIISVILSNWYVILLLILPIILFIIFDIKKWVSFKKSTLIFKLISLACLLLLQGSILISFKVIKSNDIYSNANLYTAIHYPLLTADKFGLITMFRLDCQRSLLGFKEKDLEIDTPKEETPSDPPVDNPKEEIIKYNKLDINWDEIINKEKDSTVKSIHQYISKQTPTKKNEYTGMFKDKNLIVFVAEAFAPMAIDKDLTPNLYKLYSEGFQFDNFYTPLFPVSTADGEYMSDTSLIPKEGVWSIYKIDGNYMPYSYANVFKKQGYTTQAYHNNTYTYYHRDIYIKTMGYDKYLACKNGLEKRINCKVWPQSDYQMINATVDDYIKNDKFLAYYMTVSGHLEYSREGNTMVNWNWDKVKKLPYSEAAKSYLSCNIELDKAIGELIAKLEKAGKLEDTVITISGDHYPYGLTLDQINEISTYKKDKDFEMHKMPFLIWNSEIKEPIKVDKYASSLDILPTILNLFGIDYDSRLLMGRDIMSDSESLVIYSNRSFISQNCRYNALTKKVTNHENSSCTSADISNYSGTVYNKFKYSRLILEQDYYKKLYKALNWK